MICVNCHTKLQRIESASMREDNKQVYLCQQCTSLFFNCDFMLGCTTREHMEEHIVKKMHYDETVGTCPHCKDKNTPLGIIEINRLQVMACKQCNGIWLDGGEIDGLFSAEEQLFVESHPGRLIDLKVDKGIRFIKSNIGRKHSK